MTWRLGVLLIPALALAGDNPKILYSKYFKGSVPETALITIERSGKASYKESSDDPRPLQFELSAAEASEVFALADKLGKFTRPLESPAKVANMGMKTLRYDDPPTTHEVKFNYTEDPDGRLLADWFDRVIETELDYSALERAVKFDRLGVNQAILQVQITYERKRLVAPQQFLPLLDRVIKNESFMHMSRDRAANLADAIRNPQTNKAEEKAPHD